MGATTTQAASVANVGPTNVVEGSCGRSWAWLRFNPSSSIGTVAVEFGFAIRLPAAGVWWTAVIANSSGWTGSVRSGADLLGEFKKGEPAGFTFSSKGKVFWNLPDSSNGAMYTVKVYMFTTLPTGAPGCRTLPGNPPSDTRVVTWKKVAKK